MEYLFFLHELKNFQAPKFLNPKTQISNKSQGPKFKIPNNVLVIEKLRFEIYLEFGFCDLEFKQLPCTE
jgi:hypothetical protein